MPGIVLVLEDDLLFAPRVELGLRGAGYEPRFVTQLADLTQALKVAPVLILANVGSRGIPWPQMVELAQARRGPPQPKIVGYGPHVDLDLRQRALDAGCDAVVGRSAAANSLASLAERYAWRPERTACEGALPAGVAQGIQQFNRREFYACHDSIEQVWVETAGDERLMYQGLLQIAVAFYHMQQGNWRGGLKMLERGKGKLLPFLPACRGVDLAAFLSGVDRTEVVLRELGSKDLTGLDIHDFPVISVT